MMVMNHELMMMMKNLFFFFLWCCLLLLVLFCRIKGQVNGERSLTDWQEIAARIALINIPNSMRESCQ